MEFPLGREPRGFLRHPVDDVRLHDDVQGRLSVVVGRVYSQRRALGPFPQRRIQSTRWRGEAACCPKRFGNSVTNPEREE